MTLREKLDIKIRREMKKRLYKEIENIFLSTDVDELIDGITIRITSDNSTEIFYSVVSSKSSETKKFKRKYSLETFENLIPKLRKNGIVVEYARWEDGSSDASLKYEPS